MFFVLRVAHGGNLLVAPAPLPGCQLGLASPRCHPLSSYCPSSRAKRTHPATQTWRLATARAARRQHPPQPQPPPPPLPQPPAQRPQPRPRTRKLNTKRPLTIHLPAPTTLSPRRKLTPPLPPPRPPPTHHPRPSMMRPKTSSKRRASSSKTSNLTRTRTRTAPSVPSMATRPPAPRSPLAS
jgi:hypothetical protein